MARDAREISLPFFLPATVVSLLSPPDLLSISLPCVLTHLLCHPLLSDSLSAVVRTLLSAPGTPTATTSCLQWICFTFSANSDGRASSS